MSAVFNFFFVPCVSLLVVFWVSFALVYFALSGRMRRLERKVRKLERGQGGNTEDFTLDVVRQPTPRPTRPVAQSRYITVDRQPKY